LETDDAQILAAVEAIGSGVLTFVHGEGDDAEYFGLFGGSSEDGDKKHVHLDIVRGSYFEEVKPPKMTSNESAVFTALMRFRGQRVHVAVTGRFNAPLADFAPDSVVAKLATRQDIGGIELRQTGAAYEFSAGPFDGWNWSLSSKSERVSANMRLTVDEVIDETYPKRAYELVTRAFRTAILGGKTNAR
jgi:hypothetical protein